MIDSYGKIIFHLCKGICAQIPVLGSFIEEVILEANKELFYMNISETTMGMTSQEIEELVQVLISYKANSQQIHWAAVKDRLNVYAAEYEDAEKKCQDLIQIGETEKAQSECMRSMNGLNKIINLYRANRVFFSASKREEIDALISENADFADVIRAIQMINSYVESHLQAESIE